MTTFRLTYAAQTDITGILAWSEEHFGTEGRRRYESLIATAIRDTAAAPPDGFEGPGPTPRPDLGEGVSSWHLARSRHRSPGGLVHRPRHLLICRLEGEVLVTGRVLHDSMDLPQHVDPWAGEGQP